MKNLFRNLFELYIEQKRRNGVMESTLKRDIQLFNKNLFPSLANKDVKEIKYSDLLAIFNAMFNPHNPLQSRLETIHRTIRQLHKIFEIALKDRYIDFDPSFGLSSEFPTKKRFNQNNQIDTRFASITDNEILKSFICDLKCANYLDGQTKRALYLQILCVNRPINTASAKWADIDLENGIWNIPAIEMKTRLPHQIALSKQAIKVLKEQKLFSANSEFVFPTGTKAGHLHRDSISKAIRNLGGKGKYSGIATSHGFRATFKTILLFTRSRTYKSWH